MKKHSSQRNRLLKKAFSFTITPATTSETPYLLQPGKTVVFTIQVQNQSTNADLILLKCSELPADWFTIQYLNHTSEEAPGIVQLNEKLSLSSQEYGEIQLVLHPPSDAAVGNYFPTLQLISMSAPDLVTLDVIYIQLLPDTHLDTKLVPESQAIADQPATLHFSVRNRGNLHRTFKLEVKDSGNLFHFDFANKTVKLAPSQETTIVLKASPRHRWQRPLRGNPVRSNLGVTLIPEDHLADLAFRHSTQGKLLWLPRPKWVLALLMLMGTGTALFSLGILYRFNRPAIAAAEILSFSSAGQADAAQLNWKLNNPETLSKIVVSQLNEGAEIQTVRYDFSNSIPQELKMQADANQGCRYSATKNTSFTLWQLPLPKLPWFYSLQQFPVPATMECQNVPFVPKQASTLRYKLKLFSKSDPQVPIAEYTTDAIAGQPVDPSQSLPQSTSNWSNSSSQAPRILAFTINGIPAQNQPNHTYSVQAGEAAQVVVSWSVQGGANVQLLPAPGSVGSSGSATYRLGAGESKTVTLTAQNSAGERVTQSVAISAIGSAQSDRSPFRPSAPVQPRPAPQPSSSPVEPTPPNPENEQDNPQPSEPNPETNNPPIEETSPTSSTSGTPEPDASPTESP